MPSDDDIASRREPARVLKCLTIRHSHAASALLRCRLMRRLAATRTRSALLVGTLTALAAGCGSTSSTPTSPSQTISTDVLTGTVQPPVSGALQSAFNTFTVGQGGGTVSITLTSAVETLPGGTLLTTVTMGLGVGTPSGGACTGIGNNFTTAQGGSAAQLSGALAAGSYCVQVSDVTNQLGPVAYALAVQHP